MSRIAPRPRVSASVGAALGALALACVAPSAIAAEPPPPPPPVVQQQGLDLRLGELLRITGLSTSSPGQTNLPLAVELNVPSVLSLKVDTGLGVTTPPGQGVNVGVQLPVNVDLSTPLGGAELGVNANVDASLLNGQDLIDAAAVVDVNAEADLLGLDTELGANLGADVTLGKNSALSVAGDLRLPPELERIISPAGSPAAKPLPVGNQAPTPPVVDPAPPVVDPAPPTPTPPTPTPPVDRPEPTPPTIDPTPPTPPVPVPVPVPQAVAEVEVPVVEVPTIQPSTPPLERLRDVAVAAGRSIWLPLGLMIALFAYLLGQRLLDGGAKLASAGRSATPDDEIIEL